MYVLQKVAEKGAANDKEGKGLNIIIVILSAKGPDGW